MRHAMKLVAVASLLVLVLPGAAVARGMPTLGVTFDVATTFGAEDSPFTAGGPAVEVGIMCPDGSVQDLGTRAIFGPTGTIFLVLKQFTCADGSGTFDVKLQVRVDKRGDNYSWSVVGGTDAYATLRGAGTGFGIGFADGTGVRDLYSGQVRVN